ncbi:hypothetical protein [Aestuariicoccus sp. MJ-SS9]|nr:hypothetical protein [Aestuariicoccus sp. MJ-SS9]MDU8911978.1 hypothetical protein [Aestuariicoccus sp. MJ-SS9]
MTTNLFLAGLAALTLIAVMIFAVTSKKRVDEDFDDTDHEKSSLARDN